MSLPVKMGLFYAAVFLGTGASSPYMPVWFAHQGLSGAQIGLILSLPMLVRVISAPMIALWADSFRLRRTALTFLGLGVAILYGLMARPLGFAGWAVVWFAASSAFSTISPLTDVIVLARARRDGFNYGWPRGIGSAAFIVANLVVGWLLTRGSPEVVLVWITGAAALAAVMARVLLPADPVQETGGRMVLAERWAGLGDLMRDKAFMLTVASAGAIQSAHAFYYGFSALSWRAEGIPESITGVLWAVGVAVEIGFFWFLEPWRRRLGARRLLVLGGLASVVRWTTYAFSPPLWLLFPLQALHALSYAATFLAALQLTERLSTPRNASAAQTINSALSSGVLMGLATLASGPLFDRFGAKGYLLMAAMCVAGTVGALRLYGVGRLDPA